MELRHLRYFVAVGKCLSFTRAAEMLHISQPPLSRQIQELEEEVGTALFDRTGKKTSLTEAGSYLLVEAERLLEGLEAACRNASAISDKARTLNVGCVSFFFTTGLVPFMEALRKDRPDLRLELRVMSTESQVRALMTGTIDVGFVRSWIHEDALAFEQIAEESLAIIYPETAGLSFGSAQECLEALRDRPFIGTVKATAAGLADAISVSCAKMDINPIPAYECNDAFSIIGLVATGLGWSIIPYVDLDDSQIAGVGSVRLPDKISIGVCYKAGRLSGEASEFVAAVREYFARRA
jgi:LysR family transcriptional regulator, benzoate and cis,cis-muconate-responsive activator of ben and cat genes